MGLTLKVSGDTDEDLQKAKQDVLDLVGKEYAANIVFDENGSVNFKNVNKINNNEGALLILQLCSSVNVYTYAVGVVNEGPTKDFGIANSQKHQDHGLKRVAKYQKVVILKYKGHNTLNESREEKIYQGKISYYMSYGRIFQEQI